MSSSRVLGLWALVAFAGLPLASCSSEIDNKPAAQVSDVPAGGAMQAAPADAQASEATEAAAGQVEALALDTASSSLHFVGAKVTGDHRGTFKIYNGTLTLGPDGGPAALDIEVDTTSLEVEPEKLQEHLRSADFFDVEKYPQARFALEQFVPQPSEAGSHRVSGVLELHGVTKQIEFPAKIEISEQAVTGTALFTINRKDFGIVYAGKPDDLIKDEVLLDVKMVFPRS